jgi:hypothetical protein
VLGSPGEDVQSGDLTTLKAKDLSRSLPGDLLQLQDGQHDVDKSSVGPSVGGSIDKTGSGGDRVWRESLDPDEHRVLKQFFK